MAQASSVSRGQSLRALTFMGLLLVSAAAVVAAIVWIPEVGARLAAALGVAQSKPGDGVTDAEAHDDEHGHEHVPSDPDILELSEQARKNIGLEVGAIKLAEYSRELTIPGIVVEREGRSMHAVAAPMTGLVTRVYVTEGQAVTPGDKLFDLRLTHEDVVQSQAELLRTSQELDVIRREVKRLEEATRDGAIAGKTLLLRQYELEKQEAALRSQREALILHGLTNAQIDEILRTGKLLPSLTVSAPDHSHDHAQHRKIVYQVQELKVDRGHHVATGEMLAVLTDHDELLIEGRAFEHDAPTIAQVLANKWPVNATLEGAGGEPVWVNDLDILFVGSRVDPESRALHFYVRLPNEMIHDAMTNGRRHVVWRFKPGQRVQLRVPVEKWHDRIVVPVDAIAQDGVETYVFRVNGDHLVRQPVHVEYRDQFSAVIAMDGSLYPGDVIALNAAHQLLVALKNKLGGGVDPHAGHTH